MNQNIECTRSSFLYDSGGAGLAEEVVGKFEDGLGRQLWGFLLPGGSDVSSAVLTFKILGVFAADTEPLLVYATSQIFTGASGIGDFDEGEASWEFQHEATLHEWPTGAAYNVDGGTPGICEWSTPVAIGPPSGATTYSANVTGPVNQKLAAIRAGGLTGNAAYVYFLLAVRNEEADDGTYSIGTRHNATPANRPTLELTESGSRAILHAAIATNGFRGPRRAR